MLVQMAWDMLQSETKSGIFDFGQPNGLWTRTLCFHKQTSQINEIPKPSASPTLTPFPAWFSTSHSLGGASGQWQYR